MEEKTFETTAELLVPEKKKINPKIIIGAVLIVFLGIGSGFGLNKLVGKEGALGLKTQREIKEGEAVEAGQTYGEKSEAFPDNAVGVIEKNGIEGEGTHRLLREGGESQTAYLTSSLLDLDLFAGRKVEIWGQTFAAQKAGWLLDVGAVKVLE